jgi:hypothetical protein
MIGFMDAFKCLSRHRRWHYRPLFSQQHTHSVKRFKLRDIRYNYNTCLVVANGIFNRNTLSISSKSSSFSHMHFKSPYILLKCIAALFFLSQEFRHLKSPLLTTWWTSHIVLNVLVGMYGDEVILFSLR